MLMQLVSMVLIVLSCERCVVEKVLGTLRMKGTNLNVSHSFHSPLMIDMKEEFLASISSLDICQSLSVPMSSAVIGKCTDARTKVDVEHWVDQTVSPVLFKDAFQGEMDNNFNISDIDVVIEIGPNPILSRIAKSWWKPQIERKKPLWLTSLEFHDNKTSLERIDNTMNALKTHADRSLFSDDVLTSVFANRIKIPWVKDAPHPLLQRSATYSRGVEYYTYFHKRLIEFYENHSTNGKILFPDAAMVEVGLAAGSKAITHGTLFDCNEINLSGAVFLKPFEFKDGSDMICDHSHDGRIEFNAIEEGSNY